MKIGFDHEKYLEEQSKYILERVNNYDKLYLEFGGKLLFDLHAKRVLPGFDENAKIKLLHKLRENVEVVICVYAGDIERNKIRGDFGITYDMDVMRLIDDLRSYDLEVNSVVITRYNDQPSATVFINKLERRGIKVYKHRATKGYPTDVDTIVSDEGYGKNPYIETSKPIVVVTAPGPGSGKLATCLSQLYHEYKRGNAAGYSKFETFPVWNVPLKHPLNIAYEAATVDLKDVNMIDHFHLDAYGETAVNYNRDIEMFPVLKNILNKVTGSETDVYSSPTDMGVNMIGFCISNNEVCEEAAKKEIVRRYYHETNNYKLGLSDEESFKKIKLLMNELNIDENYLDVIKPALDKSKECNAPVISLKIGRKIITGKQTDILSPASSLIINAMKQLAKIPDKMDLLSPKVLQPMLKLKEDMNYQQKRLQLPEVLTALSICSATNPIIEKCLSNLKKLKDCEAHATYIVDNGDKKTLKSLKINLTCEPEYLPTEDLDLI